MRLESWTVIIPCHNKGRWIMDTISAAAHTLREAANVSILVVENGSTDDTKSVLKSVPCHINGATIKVIYLKEAGLGLSFRAAIQQIPSNDGWVVLWSADLPFACTDLEMFFNEVKHSSTPRILIASKLHPLSKVTRTPIRSLMTWTHRQLRSLLFRSKVSDSQATQCFPSEILRRAAPLVRSNGFFFRAELLLICERWKTPLVEGPVSLRLPESPTTVRFFRDSFSYLKELLGLRLRFFVESKKFA